MKLLHSITLLALMIAGVQRIQTGTIAGLSDVLHSAANIINKVPGNFFINSVAVLAGCSLLPQSTRKSILEGMPYEWMQDIFNNKYMQAAGSIVRTVSLPAAVLLFAYAGNRLNSTKA